MEKEIHKLAKIIWDYMLMHQKLEKADIIFVLGSNDLRVADRAAKIFFDGWAPLVVCSGGRGKDSHLREPEGKIIAERVVDLGVPREKILVEQNSRNTGENILFTKKLLLEKDVAVKKLIAVQKPYMERRTFATIRQQWPEVECIVTSPQISFQNYSDNFDPKNSYINVMVGDLIRIKEYPNLGFQIKQEIPAEVWYACEKLVDIGYNKYLLN